MKTLAAFDFDGTLTQSDTLMLFLKFVFTKRQLVLGALHLSFILTAFKLKLISNNTAKEKLFAYFFAGMEISTFNKYGEAFAPEIEKALNPIAMNCLAWHQAQGHICVLVSASIENWIMPWAAKHDLIVAGTRIEVVDGKITGKFFGSNCYGDEKASRILEMYPNRKEYTLYAYGDSSGDKAMLKMADFSFYRRFE